MQRKLWSSLFGVALILGLVGCERFSTREIGAGYMLKRTNVDGHFVLIAPHDSGGLIIDEIGWAKPFIMARAAGSMYWDAIDTAHAQHLRISDEKRRTDPAYQLVQIGSAQSGWDRLEHNERSW